MREYYEIRDHHGVILTSFEELERAKNYLNNYELSEGEKVCIIKIVETIIETKG